MAASKGRGPLLAAALALTAVAASAAASAALSEPADPPAAERMREEIDDMIASGVPADDPKVELLEESLADLEAGIEASPPPDPGAADIAEQIAAGEAADAAEAQGVAPSAAPADGARVASTPAPVWESGVVLCEVVPGQLSAADVHGALCASVPQPDGTDRYVAIAPDGTVRTVVFGHEGQVRRVGDVRAGTTVPAGSTAQATPEGDLTLSPAGAAPVTVDLP